MGVVGAGVGSALGPGLLGAGVGARSWPSPRRVGGPPVWNEAHSSGIGVVSARVGSALGSAAPAPASAGVVGPLLSAPSPFG